jgi:hypothetical protein
MRKFVASCSTLLVAAAVLAACGGSGGSSKAGSTTVATNVIGSATSGDLSKLVADANKQRFKITYTDAGGNTQIYAQDGHGNTMISNGDSQTFSTPSSTITCDKTSGQYTCTASPGSLSVEANPFLGILTLEQSQLNALGTNLGQSSSETIAGRDAQCVTFSQQDLIPITGTSVSTSSPPTKASYTYCIDKNTGATLDVSTTDDAGKQSSVLVVTKFELPKPSDFTPPATPSTSAPQ